MMKKIVILFISLLFISCGSTKIRTTKSATKTKRHPVKTAPVVKEIPPKGTKSTESEILVATSKVKATTEDVCLLMLILLKMNLHLGCPGPKVCSLFWN